MNGCVQAKASVMDEDVNLNNLSHHQTYEIGYKYDSNDELFIGEIRNMKIYYETIDLSKSDLLLE